MKKGISEDGMKRIAQVFEDKMPGGLGDEASPQDFCPHQVLQGLKVEMEHTDDPTVALEITLDHLTEFPDYYTRLDTMEGEAKGERETVGKGRYITYDELREYEAEGKKSDSEAELLASGPRSVQYERGRHPR